MLLDTTHSQQTARRSYGPKVERVCEHCGILFRVSPFRLKRSPCRWHNLQCFHDSCKTGETRVCKEPTCGKEFYVSQSEINHRASEWCSLKCSRISQRKGLTRKCRTCGKLKYWQNGHLKKSPGNGWYCSETCKGPRIAETKGSIYRGGPYRPYGSNWNAQARKARLRDGQTCQDCGLHQIRPKLDVHHLIARRLYGGDFDRANDLTNLVTLCRPCHTIREGVFGKMRAQPQLM